MSEAIFGVLENGDEEAADRPKLGRGASGGWGKFSGEGEECH